MWYVHNHNDKRHHEFAIMADTGGKNGDGGKVASVWAGFGTHFDWKEAEANARLIAAAPDLLAALEMAERAFNAETIDPLVAFATVEKIRAAIAQAKG